MSQSKTTLLEVQHTAQISVQDRVTAFHFNESSAELQPLFYRRAEYLLPAGVVQAPMPTMTCRHLEKATTHLLQGHEEQALLAFKRAVASAIDAPTLIKVALACHTENYRDEAEAAFRRALKHVKDARSLALIAAMAGHWGYAID